MIKSSAFGNSVTLSFTFGRSGDTATTTGSHRDKHALTHLKVSLVAVAVRAIMWMLSGMMLRNSPSREKA